MRTSQLIWLALCGSVLAQWVNGWKILSSDPEFGSVEANPIFFVGIPLIWGLSYAAYALLGRMARSKLNLRESAANAVTDHELVPAYQLPFLVSAAILEAVSPLGLYLAVLKKVGMDGFMVFEGAALVGLLMARPSLEKARRLFGVTRVTEL